MKKILILVLGMFLLFSCGENKIEEDEIKTIKIEEKEIVKNIETKEEQTKKEVKVEGENKEVVKRIETKEIKVIEKSKEEVKQNVENVEEKNQIKKIKKNENQLIGITEVKLYKLKNRMLNNTIKQCFELNLINVDNNDFIFKDGGLLDGFKISYFDKKYILKKLEWKINCTDMPSKKDKVVFFNKDDNKYYLLENNDLENFLENGSKFFTNNDNIDESDKILILRKGINNKKGKIIILRELDENKGRIFSPATFECIGKLEKRWIKYDYKNKKEGTTLFVGFIKNITKEAKGVCEGDNKGKIEKSTISIFILEVSDEFKIVNVEKIYLEKNVENKKYCHYYG